MPARCPVARRRCLPLSLPIPLPPGPPGTRPAPATCRRGRCPRRALPPATGAADDLGCRADPAHRWPGQRCDLFARRTRPGAGLFRHAGGVRALWRHCRLCRAHAGGLGNRPPAADHRPGGGAGAAGPAHRKRQPAAARPVAQPPPGGPGPGPAAGGAPRAERAGLLRRGQWPRLPGGALAWGRLPLLPCALAWLAAGPGTPAWLHVALAVLLVLPIAPLLARVVFQPIADASVLVLLIVSLALHFLLSNLGLLFFGPEGSRTRALVDGALTLGAGFTVGGQVLLMLAAAGVLSGLFFLVFERPLARKAPRPPTRPPAVNRVGARLVGIRPARTARLAYGCASLLAGLIGVLIAPVTTMYYDSGFLIGLKAFVAAIIGGLVSYPMTALGALAVGVLESFASFWSGALKDVIVFSLLIPVLMLRSWMSVHSEEDPEELEP